MALFVGTDSVYASMGDQKADKVKIMINNPYIFSVKASIQCDWDAKQKKFKFKTKKTFKRYSKTYLSVPSSMRNCEIWVH